MDLNKNRHGLPGSIEVIHNENILNVASDYLISSGNPQLNMSGGVNGALLLKFGNSLQEELHQHLKDAGVSWMPPGYCYQWKQAIGNYKGVAYCVTVDREYQFSKDLVQKTILSASRLLQPQAGESVAFPAFGTGYGHLSKEDFGAAIKAVSAELLQAYPGTRFFLVERNIHSVEELKESAGLANSKANDHSVE
jgi:O-acetyl-ADP-ribose deacetylase (regulator of RNase III)